METNHPRRTSVRSVRALAAAGAAVLGATLAMGAVDAMSSPSAAAARKPPRPAPTTTTTPPTTVPPAPLPKPGPTGAALAGFELAITVDITQASAQFVVPTPSCVTPGEQAVAFGLGGRAGAAVPDSTAVVIVGCHGLNAPFALMRARVGSFEATRDIAFGARVTVERTASGANAATTVENRDFPSPLVGSRQILAVGGTRDTTVTFGAFAVLGPDAVVLDVPRFPAVTFTENLLDRQPLSGGTPVSTRSNVTAAYASGAGDIAIAYRSGQPS